MASILLSFAAADAAEAKQLVRLFEDAGHTVYVADIDEPGLSATSVVVVLWSPASVSSPHVYEYARVALKSGRLVQVAAADLDASLLAPVFQRRDLIPIADGEAILEQSIAVLVAATRQVVLGLELAAIAASLSAHMSSGSAASAHEAHSRTAEKAEEEPADDERERASAAAAPPLPIPRYLAKRTVENEAGQLNHKIPRSMRVGATEVVEVRLGRAHQNIATGLVGTGELSSEELPIVETMTVDLYGSPDAFKIVRQSRATQLVKNSLIWNTSFADQRFGRWLWQVTPRKSGLHELLVKVSADLSDSRGVATTEPFGDRVFPVKVRVNLGQASVRVLKWTAGGAVSGLAGAYTHEIWWPKLRALLAGAGFLS